MADAHRTDLPLAGVVSDNPLYTLMKEACLDKLDLQIGYRDLGPHPESGTDKLAIDRVSLVEEARTRPPGVRPALEFDGHGQ